MFRRYLRIVTVIGISLLSLQSINCQQLKWEAGFLGFFDNREFFNEYTQPQTMFGARTYGTLGLAINDNQKIAIGADYLFEFGSTAESENLKPILYFSHEDEHSKLKIGAFPRIGVIEMPDFLMSDTLEYYRPNVEGTFIEFTVPWGFQNIWLDWTSRQTDVNRETFMLGGSGGVNLGMFFYRHHFLMFHYAGPAIPIEGDHIRDNGGANFLVGLDLSEKTFFDSLRISTGLSFSYDRLRNVYDNQYYFGNITQVMAQYAGVGIKNTLSVGDGMVEMLGDPLYKATFYNRIDLFWKFFRKSNIIGKAEFSTHILPGGEINFSQRLVVYMNINGAKSLKSSKKPAI